MQDHFNPNGRRNYHDDKEKLRMAKNLVKSNNKKIKKALELFYAYDDCGMTDSSNEMRNLIENIRKILEED